MQCKKCTYCENSGRQQTQQYRLGRKHYRCTHPKTKEMNQSVRFNDFIGFGNMSFESPLVLKTRKRWCPLRIEKV